MYFYKFPKWQQWFYPKAIFDFYGKNSGKKNTIYLTFDDGPTPGVTNTILDILEAYHVKATFFCIGKKVKAYPELFQAIIDGGHSIGNHGMNHVNGFKMSATNYVDNVVEATNYIDSKLFRPPYGKCTPKQYRLLNELGYKIIFWSHLSYDFDSSLDAVRRFEKIKSNTKNGSIIVFHDTKLAFDKTEFKDILEFYIQKKFMFSAL